MFRPAGPKDLYRTTVTFNDLITADSELARMRNEPVVVRIKALAWATQKLVLHQSVCQDSRSSCRTYI